MNWADRALLAALLARLPRALRRRVSDLPGVPPLPNGLR